MHALIKGLLVSGLMLSVVSSAAPATRSEDNAPRWRSGPPLALSFATGPAFQRLTGWSISSALMAKPLDDQPLFVGGEVGLGFFSGQTVLSLLPTALYGFDVGWANAHPYLGVAIGPALSFESSRDNRILFEFLVRPGMQFDVAKNMFLTLEPKLGWLGSDFLFLPQASLVLPL